VEKQQVTPEERIAQRRAATRFDLWLIPVVLCVIAVSQIIRAETTTLSPWKGGGFGMFATMDAPGLRFFTVQALREDGQHCTVKVPFKGMGEFGPFTSTMGRYQKVIPTQRGLERIGVLLMESEFIPTIENQAESIRSFAAENPWADEKLTEMIEQARVTYRPVQPPDHLTDSTRVVKLAAVRLQNWRMKFDQATTSLSCEPIGEPIEFGVWR